MTSAGGEVEVRFGGARVRVAGADAALVESLRLNFEPVAPVVAVSRGWVDGAAPEVTVTVVVNGADHRPGIDARAVAGGGWEPGLLKVDPDHLDGEATWRRRTPEGFSVLLSGSGTVIEVVPGRVTVAGSGDEVFGRDVHRVIRNWYVEFLLAQGYLALHAAAARVGDTLVVLCGEKGRGKTTLLLDLLRRGAGFVTNDLLLVRPGPDGTADYQLVPEAVFLGRGTLEAFGWDQMAPEVRAAAQQLTGARERAALRCRSFFEGFPFVRLVESGSAQSVLLVAPDVFFRGPARLLGAAEVEELLRANDILAHDRHAFAWLNVRNWDVDVLGRRTSASMLAAWGPLPVWCGLDSETLWTMINAA